MGEGKGVKLFPLYFFRKDVKMKKLLLPDEAENQIDWMDVIKTGLLFILCFALLMLTFTPFIWR
jgi:hypothetical protein